MFRATMCTSSGAGSVSTEEFYEHYLLTGSDSLPAATAQYQHVAITLRSHQLLKMGTWLPETCWATCKGEIKNNTKVTSSWFLIHTELRCTINHTSDVSLYRYDHRALLTFLSQTVNCKMLCTARNWITMRSVTQWRDNMILQNSVPTQQATLCYNGNVNLHTWEGLKPDMYFISFHTQV